MKVILVISLCFSLFESTHLLYAQDQSLLALADSATSEQLQQSVDKKEDTSLLRYSKDAIHFQLDTDQTGKPIVLIHIQDTVGLLTIIAHDLIGKSQEVIRKHKLSQGFYEFALPKVSSESLKYWQIKADGQRVISFIR